MVKPAVIYIIKHKNPNIKGCYIGSTLDIKSRWSQHRTAAINNHKPLYQHIRHSGGIENWKIVPLCYMFNYQNKTDYRELERKFIEMYKPEYNINVPNRALKEWRKDNKDKMKLHAFTWRNNNKDKIRKNAKEYVEKNKEKMKETTLKWYKKNREKVKEINNSKLMCLCGCKVNRSHLKSGTHKDCKKHHLNAIFQIVEQKKKLKSNPLNINPLV